jgi:hypothetical protein
VSAAAERALAWVIDDPPGAEISFVRLAGGFSARGTAIGTAPAPYRLDYELETGEEYVTASLRVVVSGAGWARTLDLRRDPAGSWSVEATSDGRPSLPEPGGDAALLAGAVDCDLGLSPLTNTMPVLRHRLHEGGGPVDLLMAWVSVPDLAVLRSPQRYTLLRRTDRGAVTRFESGTFRADLELDGDGLVVRYPGLGHRVWPHRP